LHEIIETAYAADRLFAGALREAGYPSRWHWHLANSKPGCPVAAAYRVKIAADMEMHRAFALSRQTA
jgi:hypothetical protein